MEEIEDNFVSKKIKFSIADDVPIQPSKTLAPIFAPPPLTEKQIIAKRFLREEEEEIPLHEMKKVGIKTVPFPFQRAGIRFCMRNKSVLNGDDMGCGKTLQTLALIRMDPPPLRFFEDAKTAQRYRGNTLVICPKIVMTQWIDQYGLHLRPLAAAHTPFLYVLL